MSEKKNHHEFPDKKTLLEYLRGGLTHSERHRIEKLMLEHNFLRETVEGLASEDPALIEEDLIELSDTLRFRSSMHRKAGFNIYRIAATISLIIMTSAILYVLVDWITESSREKKLSMNQTIQTEVIDSLKENKPMPGDKVERDEGVVAQLPEKREVQKTERTMDDEAGQVMLDTTPFARKKPIEQVNEHPVEQPVLSRSERLAVQEKETPLLDMDRSIPEQLTLSENNEATEEKIHPLKGSEDQMAAAPPDADIAKAAKKMLEEPVPALIAIKPSADREARPFNGFEAYHQYFEDSLRYPAEALKNKVEGVVVVNFTVGKEGIPRNITLKQSIGHGCDKEAIRLIQQGPVWEPAILDGKVAESTVEIPVKFIIPEENQD
jgi:TonB family protein